MQAGRLRDWVLIQYSTYSQENTGEKIEVWNDQEWDWADIQPQKGQLQWRARQLQPETTHVIEMRFRRISETRHRIVFEGRIFEIIGIINDRNLNHRVFIETKETDEFAGTLIAVKNDEPITINYDEPLSYG